MIVGTLRFRFTFWASDDRPTEWTEFRQYAMGYKYKVHWPWDHPWTGLNRHGAAEQVQLGKSPLEFRVCLLCVPQFQLNWETRSTTITTLNPCPSFAQPNPITASPVCNYYGYYGTTAASALGNTENMPMDSPNPTYSLAGHPVQ